MPTVSEKTSSSKVVASAWFSSFKNMEISFSIRTYAKELYLWKATLYYSKTINCCALLLIHHKDVGKAEL